MNNDRKDVTKLHSRRKRALQSVKSQLSDVDLWRSSAAEFLATFIFIFIVCLSHMMAPSTAANTALDARSKQLISYASDPLQTSVGIALTYATLIQCFEKISGGHMNPAVTFAMVIAGHMTVVKAAVFCLAQLGGSFTAAALCYGMFPSENQQMNAVSRLHEGLEPLQGFGIEVLQSVVLIVTWLATYATSQSQLGSSAIPVGMAYLANTLWAGRLTGSSMNPVRSLPPALLSKYYTNLWVYIAGPIIGCSVGAVLYTYVFVTPDRKPRARKLTESGRSAEGESVRSEHDAHELMPLNHITPRHTSTSIVPTEALSQRDEGVTLVRAQHPAYYATMSQRSDVTQALYVQVPTSQQQPQQFQQIYQRQPPPATPHQTMVATTPRRMSTPGLQPLRYQTSSAPVTRTPSRPSTRPSTACSMPMTPMNRTNQNFETSGRHSRCDVGTPATFQDCSSTNVLIDNSVL
uniref:lens fiber major intrinsic protein-like n=1 Tax=Ciona intestinalis TaxID=7719 RepID=UPI000180C9F8|nr:lens fiber major intrinsic protein-like [Ciona intestinalis]XP_018673258.1 lens fiber major intrinsic protein-like [Ciona intestinalis]|eukprot:XP_002124819.1 lens fiber major intrinsic protein-like [Ciona intestinalis]